MKPVKRILATLISSALLVGLAVNFKACSEQSPLNPKVSEPGFKMLKSKSTSLNKVYQKSEVIGEDGGTIIVGNNWRGISKLEIPAGALDDDVQITFWWESTGFLQGGADFSPHGTTFNLPVRLEISYKDADLNGVDEDDLKLYYYHEDTNIWELIGDQVNKDKKVVIGYTDHFSRYAIGAE